ncbi:TPA: oligosaccharide flippase family protein, partial [Morganella morganii]|nr:oligosaccharide flippase family protein [Morganella morganii]
MIKNLLSLLGMQGINYLIPLVTLPYLTHTLGGFQYGVLSTVLILVQYTVLFVDFGFNLSSTKKISENRDNNYLVNNIFWNTVFAKLILLTI